MLSIDTEGWDGLVLHGAASTLAAHRVEVVEYSNTDERMIDARLYKLRHDGSSDFLSRSECPRLVCAGRRVRIHARLAHADGRPKRYARGARLATRARLFVLLAGQSGRARRREWPVLERDVPPSDRAQVDQSGLRAPAGHRRAAEHGAAGCSDRPLAGLTARLRLPPPSWRVADARRYNTYHIYEALLPYITYDLRTL